MTRGGCGDADRGANGFHIHVAEDTADERHLKKYGMGSEQWRERDLGPKTLGYAIHLDAYEMAPSGLITQNQPPDAQQYE